MSDCYRRQASVCVFGSSASLCDACKRRLAGLRDYLATCGFGGQYLVTIIPPGATSDFVDRPHAGRPTIDRSLLARRRREELDTLLREIEDE